MKVLHIISLIACLNIACTHAGDESFITQMVMNGARQIVVMAGILCIADGIVEMTDGISLLPSLEISNDSTVNGGLKTGIGTILFVAGQPSK